MNLPVASCLICGVERELAVWVDPAICGGSFHGVCFQCREAAQYALQTDAGITLKKCMSAINHLANMLIDASGKGYVSSNDLDYANDCISMLYDHKKPLRR